MPRPDYYELLDVEPAVSQQELKKAYYRQAKRFHPDLNVGDAAAEERFKLIAEAYRILGDAQERRLYDEARERELRYADAPELARMQRVVRFSVRQHYRGRKQERRSSRRRFTILPPRKKMPPWVIMLFLLFWLSVLLPFVMRTSGLSMPGKAVAPEPAKPDPAPEVVRERLFRMRAALEQAAGAGDVRAQLRLGLLLYSGSAGVEMNRTAAREWWQKAADQGNKAAAYYLQKCDFSMPEAESEKTAAPQP